MKIVNHKEHKEQQSAVLKAVINKHDPVYTAKETLNRLKPTAICCQPISVADNMHPININDLACNNITIGTACEGSAHIITDPPGATIFIDGIRQQIGGIDIITPVIIDHIPCTDPIDKHNKFKLTLPGYRDEEGILDITSSNTSSNPYLLNITMKVTSQSDIGGLLIVALTIGAFMFFFSTIDKEKKYKQFKEMT